MIEIRKALKEDIESIVPLWIKLMDMHKAYDTWFKPATNGAEFYGAELQKWIDSPDHRVMVAISNKVVIAYVTGWVSPMPPVFEKKIRGYINDVWVEDAYKSKGVGKDLVDAMRIFFKERNADMISINAALGNTRGVKFWQEQGFGPVMYYMVQHLK